MIFDETFIQSLLRCSGDSLLILSTNDYKILQANNKAKTTLQWDHDVSQSFFWTDFLSEANRLRWENQLAAIETVGNETEFTTQLTLRNHGFTDVKLKIVCLPNQKLLCFMHKHISGAIGFDICFYETMIEQLPFEFVVLDPKWRYQYVNPLVFKDPVLRAWMIGKTDFDYCKYRDLNLLFAEKRWGYYQNCADEKKPKEWIDRHVKADGSVVYMMRIIKPYFEAGNFKFLFGFGIDVTQAVEYQRELKVLMEDLQKNNEELREYAYITVHDLKEPLRNVVSFSNLLSRRYKNQLDKSGQEFLHFVSSNAERMNNLLNELSTYINIEKRDRDLEYAALPYLIRAAVLRLKHTFLEKKVSIHYDNEEIQIYCYPFYVEQLLQSLFDNAIKFCKKDILPEIQVRLIENETEWTILVIDNGIGIPLAYQKKIFSIFTRLDKVNYDGNGMGLSVCRKIVQLHRGHLGVESDGATGSTFYFTLSKPENAIRKSNAAHVATL